MAFQARQCAVGLDLGQSTVKAVCLRRDGRRRARLHSVRVLDLRAEGILDVAELREQLPGWLTEGGAKGRELTLGLPQYLTTTQLTEFPPGSQQTLGEMVAYETQQLAGLSEERFVHGHQILRPTAEGRMRVLIGTCRYSVAGERAETLAAAGIPVADFGIPGVALAAAYAALCPEAAATPGPQLLLDIGMECSTLVVLVGGEPLYIASLLCGGQRFTQALAKARGIDEESAEAEKLKGGAAAGAGAPAFAVATRALENEVRTALEHWQSQDPHAARNPSFARLSLCGGGAALPGLADALGRSFACPAEVIGVPLPGGGTDPRALVAYGLALQGLGLASVAVSLAPEEVRWLAQRRRQLPYLAGAFVLLVLTLVVAGVWMHQRLTERARVLTADINELNRCHELIPRLEELNAEIALRERMLMPLVAKGNRARRFLDGLQTLAAARAANDWFVYMADSRSYRENARAAGGKENGRAAATEGAALAPLPAAALKPLGGDIGVTDVPPEFPTRYLAGDTAPLTSLIVAGYTPLLGSEPYKPVRAIVEKLEKSDLFENVDLLPESERVEREDIFQPWVQLFQGSDVRCKAFTLRVPYATLDVVPPSKDGRTPR